MTSRVVIDKHRHIAIECSRIAGMVKFIPLVIDGFDTENEIAKDFDTRWKDASYPLERAAKLFLGYACDIGATKDALTELGKWTKVSDRESQAALERFGARRSAPAPTPGSPRQGPRAAPTGKPKGFVMLPIEEELPGVWETTPPVATGSILITKATPPVATGSITVGGSSALDKSRALLAKLKAGKK